jgi:hypothetical protein
VGSNEDEASSSIDVYQSVLWAQVCSAKDEFAIEIDGDNGILRPRRHFGAEKSIILGDIMTMAMRCFGAHSPPRVSQLPGFDEQKWHIEFGDTVMQIKVESRPYWGFGLLATSFLNKITITGPSKRRCRFVLDLASALGRPPWEGRRKNKWFKATEKDAEGHRADWSQLMNQCRNEFKSQIEVQEQRLKKARKNIKQLEKDEYPNYDRRKAAASLQKVERDIDVSKKALHEDNAAAVDRAMARIDTAFIEADPEAEIHSDVFDEVDEKEIMHSIAAEDVDMDERIAQAPTFENEGVVQVMGDLPVEVNVEAQDLLEDDIPMVDLTESE